MTVPGRQLDVNNLGTGAMFDILAPNATTIECVSAILDLDHLPDMGRMTGQLPSPAKNFNFLGSEAAERAAILYTVLETVKRPPALDIGSLRLPARFLSPKKI